MLNDVVSFYTNQSFIINIGGMTLEKENQRSKRSQVLSKLRKLDPISYRHRSYVTQCILCVLLHLKDICRVQCVLMSRIIASCIDQDFNSASMLMKHFYLCDCVQTFVFMIYCQTVISAYL